MGLPYPDAKVAANFRTLYAQNTALRRDLQDVRAELQHSRERENRNFSILNNSIQRISIQPARRRTNANDNNNNNNAENEVGLATLSPFPRDLHTLYALARVRVWDRGQKGCQVVHIC